MKTRTLKELLLYNYRYWVGYSIVIGFILYFLGWRLGSLTNGLSQQELIAAAQNSSLGEILNSPIYPLHSILQWLSIHFLGIGPLTLRFSSVLLGLFTAFFLYQLLRKWFGKPAALLSTAVFVSADWYLFIARLSTGGIEFSFWLALALLCFTKLLERKNIWLILYSIALAGLLFSPFGIYAIITLLVSLLACRVFRERALDAPWIIKLPALFIFTLSLAVTTLLSIRNLDFLQSLLGFENLPNIFEYLKNVFINTSAVALVLPDSNPAISPNGIFFVRFFELILIVFGVVMLFKTRVNRLNLTVIALATVLSLASGLSSGSRGGGLVLIPAAIFLTAGIRHFWYRWQRTFPNNPYARTMAIAPLAILFISVVSLHYISYFRLWPSRPATEQVFNSDLTLAAQELSNKSYANKTCYVQTTDENIQNLLVAARPTCKPLFTEDPENMAAALLQPQNSVTSLILDQQMRPIVDSSSSNSVRWLLVTPKNQ